MKKNIVLIGMAMVSLGLGLSTTSITANAKVYSTLPKALRGHWKKHVKWARGSRGERYEVAYTYQGYKHSFCTGMTQSDTEPESVRYVVSKGHGIYKVHTKTTMGGTRYHIDTFKRTKHTLRIKESHGWLVYNSRHKAVE